MLVGQPIHLVVIDPLVVLFHAVRNHFVQLSREVQRVSVREMPAMCQVQAEYGIARLHHCKIDSHVGRSACVRLHVRMVGLEQRFRPSDGQALDDIHVLAAAVIAASWVAFGVLVREDGTSGFENRAADEVFRRDELEARRLPA